VRNQTRIRLVAFDMEGCLTDDPTVWEVMHRKLGTWESHGQPYWERYRAGEFGYDEFARMDVAVWKGAPARLLDGAAEEVSFMPGCRELLAALHSAGVTTAIITNGLMCVARRFRDGLDVRHIYANRLGEDGGALTGQISIDVPYDAKGDVLRDLAGRLGVSAAEIASVGDSPSDIAMFRASRIGIAFRPTKQAVAEAATCVVREKDLRRLLDVLLP